jgi:hypothetical protein
MLLLYSPKSRYNGFIKQLLDDGAAVRTAKRFAQMPLSRGTKKKHEAVVKLLLEKGATCAANMDGQTLLQKASPNELYIALPTKRNIESKSRHIVLGLKPTILHNNERTSPGCEISTRRGHHAITSSTRFGTMTLSVAGLYVQPTCPETCLSQVKIEGFPRQMPSNVSERPGR